MKLTRNRIRKIHRQKNQSVRKWKKIQHRKKSRRYNTFRRSSSLSSPSSKQTNGFQRKRLLTPYNDDVLPGPAKLNHVLNKTLKNYIPSTVLKYLNQKYKDMRRAKRRKSKVMTGGGKDDAAAMAAAMAAATAATMAVAKGSSVDNNKKPSEPNKVDAPPKTEEGTAAEQAPATTEGAAGEDAGDAAGDTKSGDPKDGEVSKEVDTKNKKGKKSKAKFNLGPEITGDISIHVESYTLKSSEAYHFIDFLITSGKPYYIQIKSKPGDEKQLNISDTDIFELRRILYGNYATAKRFEIQDDKDKDKIPDNKLSMYFKTPDVIGIAGGDSISIDGNGDIMIYTGETAQVMETSTDKIINLKIQGNDKEVSVTDAKRLYKLGGNGQAPASIKTVEMRKDFGINISETEFRAQISPVTQITLKNASGAPGSKPDDKEEVFSDESNTYIANFSEGSEVTSIQTLRKSLEVARKNILDEEEDGKFAALGIFKLLNELLNNPEFSKSEGYDDFKESVFNFSYKIPGMENKYGFIQMKTFFEENGDNLPVGMVSEFWKLLSFLGHGPGGENSACLAFDKPGLSAKVLTTLTPLADGTTKQTSQIFNEGNIPTIATLLEKGLGGTTEGDGDDDGDDEAGGDDGEEDGDKTGAGASGGENDGGGDDAKKKKEEDATAASTEATAATETAAADVKKKEKEDAAAATKKKEEEDAAAAAAETKKKEEEDAAAAAATSASTDNNKNTDNNNNAAATAAALAASTAVAMAVANIGADTTGLKIEEVDAKDSNGLWYKGYIVKRYNFDDLEPPDNELPPITLLHFMGWGIDTDEFILTSEESEKIRPRQNTTSVGQLKQGDVTIDGLRKMYTDIKITRNNEKAIEVAKERKANREYWSKQKTIDKMNTAAIAAAVAAKAEAIVTAAVTDINKLYEGSDKKSEKVKKIIDLKMKFNTDLKEIVTLLLEMYTKSLESQQTWKNNGSKFMESRNSYIDSGEGKAKRDKLEQRLKSFKKSDDFKFIEYTNNYCDNIVKEFNPSGNFFSRPSVETKDLLNKLCRLFEQYRQEMHYFEMDYEYFNDNKKMNGGITIGFNLDGYQTPEFVVTRFNQNSESLKRILKFLEMDANETEILKKQLGVQSSVYRGIESIHQGGAGNKRKNVKTRRRNKPGK